MAESRSTTLPAPVLGLNTRDPLDGMNPLFCVTCDNWFPEERAVTIRKGYVEHVATGLGALPVETLAEHCSATGTRKMIAACNGKIYNVSTSTATELIAGYSNSRFQTVQMNNLLLMYNGGNTPGVYDGSTVSNLTYTGIGNPQKLIQATPYRNTLYLVDTDGKLWYGGVSAVQGALTEFPVSYLFTRGGGVYAVATWTRDNGAYFSELFVIISTEGEVLIYAGSNPDEDDWTLSGHVFLSKLLSRRSIRNVGTEIELLTQTGVVQLSQALVQQKDIASSSLTDVIFPSFTGAAKLYKDNFGWEVSEYPLGKMLIYNVPVSSTESFQFVRNALTGAWARFTGINAETWCLFNDEMYFGTADGRVMKFGTVSADDGTYIRSRLKFAFNYMNDREHVKQVKMVRPVLVATASVSFQLGVDADFENKPTTGTVQTEGTEGDAWDEATWDVSPWADDESVISNWHSAPATVGRCVAPKFEAETKNVSVALTALHILYEKGGTL
jgi:hypothetical protein